MVAAARALVGRKENGLPKVRFRHQGRHPAHGLDCAGLVIWVANQTGLLDFEFLGYERYPDGVTLRRLFDENLDKRPRGQRPEPGDVMLYQHLAVRWPCHMGIVGDGGGVPGLEPGSLTLIQSWLTARGVVETRFPEEWSFREVGCYQFPQHVGT